MKRITIPYSKKIELLKKIDSKELDYRNAQFGGRNLTKQQIDRWRLAINEGTVKKPNLPQMRQANPGPIMLTNSDVARNHELETLRLKAKLCDAYLEIGRLEKQLTTKIVERRGNDVYKQNSIQ